MSEATLLIVPGLRDAVPEHWQTLLAARVPTARTVPPMGRDNLALADRVRAVEREAQAIEGRIIVVAHSAGVPIAVHWAKKTKRIVAGALLATPPDLDQPLPAGYPTMDALREAGWLPIPRAPLRFPCIVAASRNDPLASFERVAEMARAWRAELEDLGEVGHLNPASGYGPWPHAETLIAELRTGLQ